MGLVGGGGWGKWDGDGGGGVSGTGRGVEGGWEESFSAVVVWRDDDGDRAG